MAIHEIVLLIIISIVWTAALAHRACQFLKKDQDRPHKGYRKASR
ncbi:hypothetical protein [Anaerosporomusa subterranea]|nr:hypothetical protein [Anaerosporomusa subterranea]